MKTIWGRLFLSMTLILIVVAILSYAIPKYFLKKEINQAGTIISDKFAETENRVKLIVTSLIIDRFIEQAMTLKGVTKILTDTNLQEKELTLNQLASELVEYSPTIAYLEVSNVFDKGVIIAPENAKLYQAVWKPIDSKQLLVQIPEKGSQTYLAKLDSSVSTSDVKYYYLYPSKEHIEHFKTFSLEDLSHSVVQTPNQFFEFMSAKEQKKLDKATMIQLLLKKRDADALLLLDSKAQMAISLLSDEVFLKKPALIESKKSAVSQLLFRQEGSNYFLDVISFIKGSKYNIVIGYSLSSVAEQIAMILKRPILLSNESSTQVVYYPDHTQTLISAEDFDLKTKQLTIKGVSYLTDTQKLEKLVISVLTPLSQTGTISYLMAQLSAGLTTKISMTLLGVTACVFIIALLLLARISRKITQPITQLAHAAEHIGSGNYANLSLPKIEKRKDEIATLTHSFEGMVIALNDREKIRGALNKVVSKEVAAEILKSDIELGGEERVITLLFSDIRSFTPLSNTLTPKELIQVLNKYMTHMCHIIDMTKGVVDKFVGDEIMALYGAPLFMEDHADQALAAATHMMRELKKWNVSQIEQGKKSLEIGIGVHTGPVCIGNMGAENRLNYTVIGANVNLASRMCAAAKPMQILVSKQTIEALKEPGNFSFKEVPPILLKGFDEPALLFEVIEQS